MLLRILMFYLVGIVVCATLAPDAVRAASPDRETAQQALAAADSGQWPQAQQLADRSGDPLFAKLVTWMRLGATGGTSDFAEIAAFLTANPDWPGGLRLRRRAEELMDPSLGNEAILSWFASRPPITAEGAYQLARAQMEVGRNADAAATARSAWIGLDMSEDEAKAFRGRFGKLLGPEDEAARLDRLLWDRKIASARQQMELVDADRRQLAQARIALMLRARNAEATVAKVPSRLRDNPGLVFDLLRWSRLAERTDEAIAILERRPERMIRAEHWWRERRILVRHALKEGDAELAYRLAADHGQSEGEAFAELEWLAGWIALRHLQRPAEALPHFKRLYDNVNFPISLSRGAYWVARSYEALEQEQEAAEWYRTAARYTTRFYGQIAAGHLLERDRPRLQAEPVPVPADVARFEARELTAVVRLLGALDRRSDARPFLIGLTGSLDSDPEWVLAAQLAQEIGRPDLSVDIARRAAQYGIALTASGYPALSAVKPSGKTYFDPTLVHAVVRQESGFDTLAISRAGARGLMQLMPATANQVARQLRMPYSRSRLTLDPEYNLKLGQAYLSEILEAYDGSLILGLAAYNAGPHRVDGWLRENGDPGPHIYAAIDWIESIPFSETRSYVQRVLENLMVYRGRESSLSMALTLAAIEPGLFKNAPDPSGAAPKDQEQETREGEPPLSNHARMSEPPR